jgi:hypothetical protein
VVVPQRLGWGDRQGTTRRHEAGASPDDEHQRHEADQERGTGGAKIERNECS